MRLAWRLCDLWGRTLAGSDGHAAALTDRQNGQVGVGLNDLRNASVQVPAAAPAAAAARTMQTLLKVTALIPVPGARRLHVPVFCGPLLKVSDPDEGGLRTLEAVDIGWRLSRLYLDPPAPANSPHVFVATGRDQGMIVIDLLAVAQARYIEALHAQGLGIVQGAVELTRLRDRRYEPLAELWRLMLDLTAVIGGPDIELEPVDRTDGTHARLNVYARQGRDQRAGAQFHHGWGRDNARIEANDSAEQLVNRAALSGQAEEGRVAEHFISVQPDSAAAIGPHESADARTDISESDTLADHARAVTSSLAWPLTSMTIKPSHAGRADAQDERGAPPVCDPSRTLEDGWWIGDLVGAVRKLDDGTVVSLDARIERLTLREGADGVVVPDEIQALPEPELHAVT